MKYQAKLQQLSLYSALSATTKQAMIQTADADYRAQIDALSQQVQACQHKIVLLAGPSGSGKTTTAQMLSQSLVKQGKVVRMLSLDDFYRAHYEFPVWEDGQQNYESIDALDLPLYARVMGELTQTGKAEFPVFDFRKKEPTWQGNIVEYTDDTVLIIEGIHALNPLLQQGLPQGDCHRVYVSVHADYEGDGRAVKGRDLRFMRRLIRDSWNRHTDAARTLQLWGYVLRGEVDYIQPFRSTADTHINSAHAYEPYLYAPLALALFDTLGDAYDQPALVARLRAVLPDLPTIATTAIPSDSLMQEFIGGI